MPPTREEQRAAFKVLFAGRSPFLLLVVGAAVGGLILICLFAVLLFRPDSGGEVIGTGPTPFSETTATPSTDVLISSDTMTVSLTSPVDLVVGGRSFPVQSQAIPIDGTWAPALDTENTAVWIYGTVINYVVAMTDSANNRALIERLAPGDEMVLRSRDGTVYNFAFNSRRNVPAGNRDIFAQNAPGLTIVLLGASGDERLVAHGRYVVSETTPVQDGNVVDLGETAQMEGVQVTVTGATHLFDRPEVPSGFAFYTIDFQMQNVGPTVLDTSALRLTLADHLGNQYALNPAASQVGNHLPVGGVLSPGQSVEATAGYQIPAGLNSPVLRWSVSHPSSASQIQVNIPFRGTTDIGQQTVVTVQQAEVSVDGTSLLLLGQLTNLGDQPLVVQEQNVTLRSEGTVYLILSTNPGFPWIVAPGQTVPFSLTFQRPLGSTAEFNLLNQPFQLSGLR